MNKSSPVIGITAYVEPARWGVWELPAVLLPLAYVSQVQQAGGVPVLLPPSVAGSPEVISRLDGLILAGGADIDPAQYGQDPHPQTIGLRPDRDVGESALAKAAMATDLPTLGICRGMQLLALVHGGSLEQHLPDLVGHEGHRAEVGVFGDHAVEMVGGSRVHEVLGASAQVKSYHHQGVADPGSLTVTAWADDGVIEAVEVPDRRFAVGVLWHPEMGDDPRLFDALVDAARP